MKRLWDVDELTERWSLSFEELAQLKGKSTINHLGFVAQLKYFQITGTFPQRRADLPEVPLSYLADQLDVALGDLHSYDWHGRTGKRHRAEILRFLQIRKATEEDYRQFTQWLVDDLLPADPDVARVQAEASLWFFQHKIELPPEKRLQRVIQAAGNQFTESLFTQMEQALPLATKERLDTLLQDDGTGLTLSKLKADPGHAGLDSVVRESEKLAFLRNLELPENLLKHLHPKLLGKYRQRLATESAWEVRRHPPRIRYAVLAIYCFLRQREITDGLIDLFIQIVHRISVRAERKVVKELLRDFQKVHGKTTLLFRIAEASLDRPQDTVQDVVYPIAGETTLSNLVKEFKSTGVAYTKQVHTLIRSSYSTHYRRMLPKLLEALSFRSNNQQHRPVLDALVWIERHRESKRQYYQLTGSIPIEGVVRPKWRDVVIEKQGAAERINRINYEICVLQALRDKLRCKEIWVVGADRFRNPDEDLPTDFYSKRAFYYQDLGHSENAEEFIAGLQASMRTALSQLNATLPKNKKVRLQTRGKNPISISPLDAQPDPVNIEKLKREIAARWPMTSLLDILKEADLRIGFTDCFHSAAAREALDRDTLQKRLLLCLFGMGTNAGLKRVITSGQNTTYKELLRVRHRYIQKATLRQAISQVANAIFAVRNPDLWGEGTTSCASDSKKFGAWDQNLMTEWHIRYGGRGVMIYWHVEKKSVCIYSQLKRCSSSEVASMIEGVLRHCTEMSVDKQYVDSHGQSEAGFAFCHLLGFNLMPRLKAIGSQKLYRVGDEQPGQYRHLDPILTRPINWDLIRQQYDEMIKYATALKQGTADPEAILRRFTRNNVQHPTYRALAELGKAVKTQFLCQYLESEEVRREIHEGLNVVENWNSANSFIFYGKGGEVATNRLDDQELAVLALHLLQICLVYVNTLMIQQIAAQDHWVGRLTEEDYRALTPLIYLHVNPYGRFDLDMEQRLPIDEEAGFMAVAV